MKLPTAKRREGYIGSVCALTDNKMYDIPGIICINFWKKPDGEVVSSHVEWTKNYRPSDETIKALREAGFEIP